VSNAVALSPTDPEIRAVTTLVDSVELHLEVSPRLTYFEGHFPTYPILPGVVQIDWAVRLADRYLDTSIGAARAFRVKFRAPIGPGLLHLRLTRHAGKLGFEYRRGADVVSSGIVEIAP